MKRTLKFIILGKHLYDAMIFTRKIIIFFGISPFQTVLFSTRGQILSSKNILSLIQTN